MGTSVLLLIPVREEMAAQSPSLLWAGDSHPASPRISSTWIRSPLFHSVKVNSARLCGRIIYRSSEGKSVVLLLPGSGAKIQAISGWRRSDILDWSQDQTPSPLMRPSQWDTGLWRGTEKILEFSWSYGDFDAGIVTKETGEAPARCVIVMKGPSYALSPANWHCGSCGLMVRISTTPPQTSDQPPLPWAEWPFNTEGVRAGTQRAAASSWRTKR